MKSKTINTILCKKFDDFLKSIDDPVVADLVKNNTIITGGSIVSLLLGDKVNDYDLYFRNKETVLAVAKYYVGKFRACPPAKFKDSDKQIEVFVVDGDKEYISGGATKHRIPERPWYDDVDERINKGRVRIVVKSSGAVGADTPPDYQYFEGIANREEQAEAAMSYVDAVTKTDEVPAAELDKDEPKAPRYQLSFMSGNAISLTGKVQLIVRFYGEPEQIHENYDFAHCTSYWTSWERKLTLRPEAMEAILSRELKYVGSRYPLCSIIRTRKFLGRGWTINAGQYVKMAWQLNQLNLSDIRVLEDQLVGVDAAYFLQIVALLSQRPTEQGTVDGTYLVTLIDKLF